jgi:hypothetical protein
MKKKSFRSAIVLAALFALTSSAVAGPGPGKSPHPSGDGDHDRRVKHVFVIVLENEGFDVTFGPNSKAPYLSQTLPTQGVLLNENTIMGAIAATATLPPNCADLFTNK